MQLMRHDTGQDSLDACCCYVAYVVSLTPQTTRTCGKKSEPGLERRGRAGAPAETLVEGTREMSAAGVARAVSYSSSRCG